MVIPLRGRGVHFRDSRRNKSPEGMKKFFFPYNAIAGTKD